MSPRFFLATGLGLALALAGRFAPERASAQRGDELQQMRQGFTERNDKINHRT